MSCTVRVHHHLAEIYPVWRLLWQRDPANPFLHPGWSAAFAQVGGGALETRLITVWEGEVLRGVLPLRLDRDGVHRFLAAPRADYEDALVDPDRVDAVCDHLCEWLMTQRFELAEMPGTSALGRRLAERGAKRRLSAECPGIALSGEVMAQLRRRDSLRRHERKLGKVGPLKLEAVTASDRAGALGQLMDQHISRWLAAGGPSLFLDSRNEQFYQALIAQEDFAEFAALHRLWAGDRVVALHFGLIAPTAFIWYKPAFDLNLANMGPGEVLFRYLLEDCWGNGRGYFDFTRGGEAFKKRFATQVERNQSLSHRLPVVRPMLERWRRRVLRLKKLGGHVWREVQSRLQRHDDLYFQLQTSSLPGDPPEGCQLTFGEVDLVGLGAQHRWHPQWVNAARMKRAVERRQRGDRMLSLTNAQGHLQHASWVRFDTGSVKGDGSVLSLDTPRRVAVIYDCWTAAESRGRGCYPWALKWLTHQLGQEGHEVWIYTSVLNAASTRGIEKAGVVRRVALPHGHGLAGSQGGQ